MYRVQASPFEHHGPLRPADVRGRDHLIADLISRVTSRRVTALVGPRRYGKTSVLTRMAAELSEVATVLVDLYEVTSMASLVVRFDTAMDAVPAPFRDEARSIATSLQLNLGLARVELSRPARQQPDPTIRFAALLDVLVGAATRAPTLLVIDEFSSITRVAGAAGALRTALQHHYRDLGIVFAGSMPSVMRQLFTDRLEPFYAQADLVEIEPLDLAAVTAIVADGFGSTGRDHGILAGPLFELTRGHPHRMMQLADACWRQTPQGAAVTDREWSAALSEVRTEVSSGMAQLFSHHRPGERDVLRVVSSGGALFGNDAALLDLSTGAAQHARDALLAAGDLVKTGSGLRVTDPILADWVARTLPIP